MQLPTALTAPHRLLAAFTLVGALLLALLWAIVLTEVERHRAEVLRDVEQVVVLKAQLYAEATRPVLQRLDALLLDLREHWSGDPDAMAALVASRQRSTPDLPFRITVFDADGGRAFESHGSPGEPPDSAAQSRFAAHRGAPGRDALAVGAGLRAGRREIVLSRPIHAREHFIGAIEVGLAPTVFSRIHPTLGLGPAGISLIVLDDGQPLVRRPDSGLPAMAPIEALAHQTDAEPTGLRRFADASDGADRIAGLSRLPAYGWTFVAAESVDAVLAPNRTFRTVALGGAAAASLVTALLLFAACRARLTRLRALDSLAAQERMLADQRHLTRALLNTVGDLIWLKDANGVYLACNTRFEQFFGAAEHEILGKTDYDFVDAALADFFRQNDRRAMEKNGPTTNREWVRFASDGHSELLETTKTPMVDAQGRLIGVLGVGHNITDAQALQDALEASHRELLEAQAVARLGSWSLDLDSERIIWSPVAYELFGVPAGEPIDLSRFLSLIHPDDLPHVEAQWQAAMSSGSYDVEHRTIVNGEERWLRERADFVRDDGGNVTRAIGTVLDITARRRLEGELREQRQRLAAIIEGTGVGTWEWFIQSGRVLFNERWAELTGHTLDTVGPFGIDTWIDAIHPDDRARVEAQLEAHVSGASESFESEFRLRHRQGHWVWVLALGRINQWSPAGQPLRMSGTKLDITVRKATEQALSALAGAMTQLAGTALYQGICRHLALALDLDFVFTGQLDDSGKQVDVIAGWHAERPMSTFSYALEDTPCADAMKRSTAVFPSAVSARFPQDVMLADMGIESYIGSTLFDKNGHPMGILVGLGRRTIHQTDLANRLFGVFVDSVSAEMMRAQAEETVIAARNRLDAILQTTRDAVWLVDYDGRLTDVNPAACAMSGYPRAHMLAMNVTDLDASHDASRVSATIARIRQRGSLRFESRHETRDGALVNVDVAISDLPGESLIVAFIRDITARKRAEEGLRQAASVFEFSHEGIMITDPAGTIIDVNDAFCRITGYARGEAIGSNPRILKSGRHDDAFYQTMWQGLQREGHWTSEVWNRRKDGDVYAQKQTISAVRDTAGEVLRYVCLFSDITELKEHQHQLERIAHYDALTGLPNRVLLADRISQAMAQARRHDTRMAVAFLDLDGFKAVNDNHSHEIGDKLLTQLSGRMQDALRQTDTLSRLGGDEFVAVLVDLESLEASAPVIDRLLGAAAEPVYVDGLEMRVSASIGLSFYPQASEVDGDQLLRQADQAMYLAKQAGKNRFHVFDVEHDRSVRGRHESLERIGLALARGEFVLHYQPRVNMRTGDILGAEALIRWQHPERGLLPPAAFLPTIKNNPLTEAVGGWVLETALAQIEAWSDVGLNVPVSVNVDARQLDRPDFMDTLRAALARHPSIRPGDLELEVLETSALEDIDQISEIIDACGELGVHFALDDFGTGYSSLTYLRRLPARNLKIDQSFVRGMLDSPEDLAILGGVLSLAEAFRRQAIAEGVESVPHGIKLIQMGCVIGQGYAIARPMPADAFAAWAESWQPDPAWTGQQPVDRSDLPVIFAMVEHRAWVAQLHRHLHEDEVQAPTLDPHQCQFGRWLDDIGSIRHGSHPAFARIVGLHETIHDCAGELVTLKGAGESTKAQSRLGEISALRDALLQELDRLAT
ncbi:MAG: PAS domain S-box protein [Rhodocyclaceae bacterium]|nr:PAS domain S-box protein [Rhodocyclaceae bacterium]